MNTTFMQLWVLITPCTWHQCQELGLIRITEPQASKYIFTLAKNSNFNSDMLKHNCMCFSANFVVWFDFHRV